MKKILLLTLVSLSHFYFSQSWDINGNTGTNSATNFLGTKEAQDMVLKTNNTERIRVNSVGNVEILAAPDPSLTLKTFGRIQFNTNTFSDGLQIFNQAQMNAGSDIVWISSAYQPNDTGLFSISTPPSAGDWSKPVMSVRSNGKIFMGLRLSFSLNSCSDCSSYRLFVQEGIRTEKIKVDIASANGWADYVFNKNYKLLSLSEVERHIEEKGHLPNIPAADDVVKNGINLGEMDAKLLEKIEELTLYVIQLNKDVKKLEEENKQLKKKGILTE